MKQTLTYLSKTIAPQLLSGTNAHYGQVLQGIRVVELAVKLGKIKSTYIPEQHFDLIQQTDPENYLEMTVAGGLYSTAKDWAQAFCDSYAAGTGYALSYTIDETNTFLKFNGPSNIQIQQTEKVNVTGHNAIVSFSDISEEFPSPNINIVCPIPDGSYTPKEYAAALESALNISQPGNTSSAYTVTYDRASDRMQFVYEGTEDNNRYLYFNDAAAKFVGVSRFMVWHRYGGEDPLRVAEKAPQQLNPDTADLSVVGYPYASGRGLVTDFAKPYISIDGAYDTVLLCSNALRHFGTLVNGTNSNVLVVLPTMGVIQDWVKNEYAHRSWHVPTSPILYNSIDFYITDASGHVFEDARFIVTLEIQ